MAFGNMLVSIFQSLHFRKAEMPFFQRAEKNLLTDHFSLATQHQQIPSSAHVAFRDHFPNPV
jgi:hypothetical protein